MPEAHALHPGTIDLHAHSRASDGVLSPSDLVRLAAESGVRVLAVTDHDTTAGLAEATEAGQRWGTVIIPGVEFSCRWERMSLHIVGLGMQISHPGLCNHLAETDALRRARAEHIARKLAQCGIADALAETQKLAGHDRITRTHFARYLVAAGHTRDLVQAFKRYLGTGKPASVGSHWHTLDTTIDVIRAAGGLAVLAHPARYRLTRTRLDALLRAFRTAGGAAIEISTSSSTSDERTRLTRLCLQHGLAASAGSDFHDPQQQWIRFGSLPSLSPSLIPIWCHPSWPGTRTAQTAIP